MDVQSPSTLFGAWILAPGVIVLASGGLGCLVARIARLRFGPLTFPVGFLAGIVLMTGLLKLGTSGTLAAAVTAVFAIVGGAVALVPAYRRSSGLRELGTQATRSREVLAPALGAAGAYFAALAPLAGSGRVGVLGYILNNDPSAHASLVELLRENGTEASGGPFTSSYDSTVELGTGGYPLGSHVWPMFGRVTTGIEPFDLWSPAIAVAAAMLALVAYAYLRRLAISPWPAAAAGALVPCGYLFYSFLIQGSAKEAVTAVAVYGSIAIAGHIVLDHPSWRALPSVAIGPAAALFAFGAGAGSWIAPAAVAFLVVALFRLRRVRPPKGVLIAAAAGGIAIAVVSVPVIREALDYVRSAEETLRSPRQVGNLLGGVPWQEAFNLWFAYDFRIQPPEVEWLSDIGSWIGGAFAMLGLVYAAMRREIVLPVAVFAGAVATIVISRRYNIYLDAKAYAILAPALGIAAAAGVGALLAGPRVARVAGIVAGITLAVGVLGGASLVYAGAWVTPKDRFEEVAEIAERFDGQGPILVNEREEWDFYLLRELDPVVSWGFWFDRRGFRTGEQHPPPLPHTPDFDDYYPAFLQRFPLLLERKGPGGSRPPVNYEPSFETSDYRMWRRDGDAPSIHLALGPDGYDSSAPLDCDAAATRRLFGASRQSGRSLVAAVPPSAPKVIIGPDAWREYEAAENPPPSGFITRRGGIAAVDARLATGHYDAWLQGSFGPGLQLRVGDTLYGTAQDDLGLPSAWHWLGRVSVPTRALPIALESRTMHVWEAGSKRSDTTGRLVFLRHPGISRPVMVRPERARELCGRRLDWIELSPG